MSFSNRADALNDLEVKLSDVITIAIGQIKNLPAPYEPAKNQHLKKAREIAQQYAYGSGIFKNLPEKACFSKVQRSVFAKQLMRRLEVPSDTNPGTNGTNQGNTYLCGPSAAIHLLLNLDPLNYLKLAILLFETGRARIGKSQVGQTVIGKLYKETSYFYVSDKMKEVWQLDGDANVTATKYKHGTMGIVDYVMVGALRNAANPGHRQRKTRFDPQDNGPIIGIPAVLDELTLPYEIKGMLDKFCGFDVPTAEWATSGEDPSAFWEALKQGIHVVLFIDGSLSDPLDPKAAEKENKGEHDKAWKKDSASDVVGSHFVVIRHDYEFSTSPDGKRVNFRYWDYGGRKVPVNTTLAQFQSSVKGYWFVKPKYW